VSGVPIVCRAAQCSLEIQSQMHNAQLSPEVRLSVN
jgi:hypothetical protein